MTWFLGKPITVPLCMWHCCWADSTQMSAFMTATSINSSNDYPADGHGYVPTRGSKKDSDTGKENVSAPRVDSVDGLTMATKIRDLSNSINLLQERLVKLNEGDAEREDVLLKIKEFQVAIENMCSVNSEVQNPQESVDIVNKLLVSEGFNPSSMAIKRLLDD